MKRSQAKIEIIKYVLDSERDDFHQEWATVNLKGIPLEEAYLISKNHIFIMAVIANYGMKEYRSAVKIRWGEVNKRRGQ